MRKPGTAMTQKMGPEDKDKRNNSTAGGTKYSGLGDGKKAFWKSFESRFLHTGSGGESSSIYMYGGMFCSVQYCDQVHCVAVLFCFNVL